MYILLRGYGRVSLIMGLGLIDRKTSNLNCSIYYPANVNNVTIDPQNKTIAAIGIMMNIQPAIVTHLRITLRCSLFSFNKS